MNDLLKIKLQAQLDCLKWIEQTDRDYPIAVAVARAEGEVREGRLLVPLTDEQVEEKRLKLEKKRAKKK